MESRNKFGIVRLKKGRAAQHIVHALTDFRNSNHHSHPRSQSKSEPCRDIDGLLGKYLFYLFAKETGAIKPGSGV